MSADPVWTNEDRKFMKRALELAENGRGRTAPNPLVGAVIAKGGAVIGEGFHAFAGGDHAEISALKAAGDVSEGVLYTTLEPCSLEGRTPPCVDAIAASGLKEVVVGAIDPNPRVEGLGASFLREKNLRVRVGLLAEEVMEQNEIYWKYTRTSRPFVLLKIAASLNGRIESPADDRWITGDQARTVVHQLRNDYDAVLTGVGTVEADDPRLDCRMPGVTNDPVRIVLDSRGRTPLSSQLVRNARKVRTVVVATGAGAAAASTLHRHGVELVVLPERDGKVDLEAFLDWAGENDISSLLVEAGARVNGSFVEQGLADKILFFIAPRFLDDSFSGAVAPGVRSDGFTITSVEGVGSDLAVILAPTPSRVIGGQPAGTDSPAQGHECREGSPSRDSVAAAALRCSEVGACLPD